MLAGRARSSGSFRKKPEQGVFFVVANDADGGSERQEGIQLRYSYSVRRA